MCAPQAQPMDDDDPTSSYMLQAGARICKCLGDEFLPYMEVCGLRHGRAESLCGLRHGRAESLCGFRA